jgi:hypothetical protein
MFQEVPFFANRFATMSSSRMKPRMAIKDGIRTIMTSQHAHIQREYGMTDDNCYLSFKQEKGSSVAEYTLYAWPYYIKISLDGNQFTCRFVNDCEGVSHDGIRRDLKHLVDKIKDAFL